jgi:YesN/AraC family two-component response regulator
LSEQPDLVISDVNMPEMDGFALVDKIKKDGRTGHIPVVLLTALSAEEDQLRALESGANDYIAKPFNMEILISRILNLLKYKGSLEEGIRRRMTAEPQDIAETPDTTNDDFVKEAIAVLQKNMANADFSVEDWSREMGLSRTSLYKRIIATTGKTPIGFIRTYRMNRAAQLLERTRHNVAQVAYMVGYNNPKYFASNFKEEFGVLPSAYQADRRKKK